MRRSAFLLFILGFSFDCHSDDTAPRSASPWPGKAINEISESSHTVLASDGVRIHYDDQGQGKLSLVFVHGWNCDRGYWNAQRDFFAKSHRVVTLDLAGHGESDQGRVDWTMQAFGADVVAVVSALDLHNVVLIGHSMGGKVVVEAASQLNSRVIAVVGADTFHNGGRATPQPRRQDILDQLAEDYSGYVMKLGARMFVEQSDPAIKDFVLADLAAAPFPAAIGARRASGSFDASQIMASLDVPLILISSDYLPTDVAHLKVNARAFQYLSMSGVGHFVMLEDPDTFNALLAEALADLT